MATRNKLVTSQKMVNMVQADQVQHICWDGGKLNGVIHSLKNGVDRQLLDKAVTPKVVDRAIALLDKMRVGQATLVKHTPLELGFIRPCEDGFELTERGELEIAVISGRDADNALRSEALNSTLAEGAPKISVKAFAPLATVRFLRNEMLWMRKYKSQLKTQDEGMAIWQAYMKGAFKSPIKGVESVILRLLHREEYSDVSDAVDDIAAKVEKFFPAKDEYTSSVAEIYKELLDTLESKALAEEDAEDEDLKSIDMPFNQDGDEAVTGTLDQLFGSYVVSSDPTDKRRGFIFGLFALRRKMKKGEMKFITNITKVGEKTIYGDDELYESYIRPIVDHYTGKALLGSDQDYVQMPMTDDEKAAAREDFPYDSNITFETVRKYPKPELREILKDTNLEIISFVPIEMGTDEFEAKFFKPKETIDIKKVKLKAGDRMIVKKSIVQTKEFNQEMEFDWEINNIFARVGDDREWRKQVSLHLLSTPVGKEHLDKRGYQKVTDDYFLLRVKARFLKAHQVWEKANDVFNAWLHLPSEVRSKTKRPAEPGFEPNEEKLLARCQYYYYWNNL